MKSLTNMKLREESKVENAISFKVRNETKLTIVLKDTHGKAINESKEVITTEVIIYLEGGTGVE